MKSLVICLHLQSKKHVAGKECFKGKQGPRHGHAESFKVYSQKEHVVGETLSSEGQVHRIKVVGTFLKAGVPMNEVDSFRELLEENCLCLAERSTLSDRIPFVHEMEKNGEKTIVKETEGRKL